MPNGIANPEKKNATVIPGIQRYIPQKTMELFLMNLETILEIQTESVVFRVLKKFMVKFLKGWFDKFKDKLKEFLDQ